MAKNTTEAADDLPAELKKVQADLDAACLAVEKARAEAKRLSQRRRDILTEMQKRTS